MNGNHKGIKKTTLHIQLLNKSGKIFCSINQRLDQRLNTTVSTSIKKKKLKKKFHNVLNSIGSK